MISQLFFSCPQAYTSVFQPSALNCVLVADSYRMICLHRSFDSCLSFESYWWKDPVGGERLEVKNNWSVLVCSQIPVTGRHSYSVLGKPFLFPDCWTLGCKELTMTARAKGLGISLCLLQPCSGLPKCQESSLSWTMCNTTEVLPRHRPLMPFLGTIFFFKDRVMFTGQGQYQDHKVGFPGARPLHSGCTPCNFPKHEKFHCLICGSGGWNSYCSH